MGYLNYSGIDEEDPIRHINNMRKNMSIDEKLSTSDSTSLDTPIFDTTISHASVDFTSDKRKFNNRIDKKKYCLLVSDHLNNCAKCRKKIKKILDKSIIEYKSNRNTSHNYGLLSPEMKDNVIIFLGVFILFLMMVILLKSISK